MTDTTEIANVKQIIPWDRDGKTLHFTGFEDEGKLHRNFHSWAAAQGLGQVLDPANRFEPVEPLQAFERAAGIVNAGPPLPDDARIISYFTVANSKWTIMCHKLLEAYKQMLSKDVQIFLATVIPDMDEGTRANILATIAAVHAQYGGYTREKGEFNFACIGEIPKFTSAVLITSGILALDELYLERAGWATVVPLANYGYEDAVMKGHLIEKMGQWRY